jgi:WhiB family transcriptional regulator, redox-sensing transcriptional regulator
VLEHDELLASLAALLVDEAWKRDALRLEHTEVEFFPGRGESCRPAQAICARCLVQRECRDFAVANGEKHGIWGGLGERERRRLRRDGILAA